MFKPNPYMPRLQTNLTYAWMIAFIVFLVCAFSGLLNAGVVYGGVMVACAIFAFIWDFKMMCYFTFAILVLFAFAIWMISRYGGGL